jgi:lipopolysaccharide transport system ATP-binding protein
MQHGVQTEHFDGDEETEVVIVFKALNKITNFRIGFFIKTSYGETLLRSLAADWVPDYSTIETGTYRLKGKIPADFLTHGNYIFELHSSQFGVCDYFADRISFPIQLHKSRGYNQQHPTEEAFGSVHLNANWILNYINND